jgi:hypothetical protein
VCQKQLFMFYKVELFSSICCLVIMSGLSLPFYSSAADLYYGTVRYQLLQKSPYAFDRLYTFAFQNEGCSWAAQITPIYCNTGDSNDAIIPDYEFASYDGKTCYDVISYKTATLKLSSANQIASNERGQTTVAQASLFREDIPWGVNPVLAQLWLEFGSKCYLQSRGDGEGAITPFRYGYTPTSAADAQQTISAIWKTAETGSFYVTDFVAYNQQAGVTSPTSVATNLQSELVSTNEALVTMYSNDGNPETSTAITLTNVEHGDVTMPFVALIPGPTMAKDFRFALFSTPFSYGVVVKSSWPSIDFAQVNYMQRSRDSDAAKHGSRNLPKAAYLVLLITVFVLPPSIYFCYKLVNKAKQNR